MKIVKSIYEINKNIAYVKGAARGAIYNFDDGKVYSINEDGCKIIEQYIFNQKVKNPYLEDLEKLLLISNDFLPKEYEFQKVEKELNFVWLELTEACNLRCIHCYDGDEHMAHSSEQMSFEQWKTILNQLKNLDCKKIEFIGGEPTVYPRFFDLLKYAVSIDLKAEIYSNLLLFTKDLVNYIKAHNITVHFSIYGSKAKIHDPITGKAGSFKKTIYWAKELIKNGVKVIPAITIMRKNQDDYENIMNLLKSLHIDLRLIAVDTPRATDKRTVENIIPNSNAKYISFRAGPNFSITKSYFDRANYTNTCLFGKFSIQPNGNVSPCEFARNIVYGNLKSESVKEILQSEVLNRFWFLDFSKIEKCSCCEYRFACKDCRMITINEDLYAKNIRCLYNPETGTWGKKYLIK